MKILIVLALTSIMFSCAIPKTYFTPKSNYTDEEIRASHKSIAILPFNFAYNQDSRNLVERVINKNDEPLSEQIKFGNKIQSAIYQTLINVKTSVIIMDIADVNQILKFKNISYAEIRRMPKSQIAEILQVDAVIYGDIFLNGSKPQNPVNIVPFDDYTSISTNQTKQFAEFVIEIHGRSENEIVWKAKSTFDRYFFNDEVEFEKIIKDKLIPILPYSR